jgi:hypothetical protein
MKSSQVEHWAPWSGLTYSTPGGFLDRRYWRFAIGALREFCTSVDRGENFDGGCPLCCKWKPNDYLSAAVYRRRLPGRQREANCRRKPLPLCRLRVTLDSLTEGTAARIELYPPRVLTPPTLRSCQPVSTPPGRSPRSYTTEERSSLKR